MKVINPTIREFYSCKICQKVYEKSYSNAKKQIIILSNLFLCSESCFKVMLNNILLSYDKNYLLIMLEQLEIILNLKINENKHKLSYSQLILENINHLNKLLLSKIKEELLNYSNDLSNS